MASVKRLADRVAVGAVTTKNRICIPPMVRFHLSGPEGLVTEEHVAHYTRLARGGAGLIIQEATCVMPEGRLSEDQLGIWSEEQLPGLRRIVAAAHGAGCPIFVQLHHGGVMATEGRRVCPSDYTYTFKARNAGQRLAEDVQTVQGEALTLREIREIRQAFIDGGRRAYRAGYDGVELHGCHSYLLCQFLNRNVNRRTDEYADGLRLVREITEGIRAATSPEFVIGIRLGGFEPDLADGIAHARALEALGIQFLDISYGFSGEMDLTAPGDPAFSAAVRATGAIQAAVHIPVFAVDGIRTPWDAEKVLTEMDVDMVDVGRSALVDPNWPEKALRGETPGRCLGCKDCQWRIDPARCPGRRLLEG